MESIELKVWFESRLCSMILGTPRLATRENLSCEIFILVVFTIMSKAYEWWMFSKKRGKVLI